MHKKKVTHVEFNSRCDWLLATASVDQTVKIWDLRNIKDKSSYLHELPHDKPVNAGKTVNFCNLALSNPVSLSPLAFQVSQVGDLSILSLESPTKHSGTYF